MVCFLSCKILLDLYFQSSYRFVKGRMRKMFLKTMYRFPVNHHSLVKCLAETLTLPVFSYFVSRRQHLGSGCVAPPVITAHRISDRCHTVSGVIVLRFWWR